MCLGGPHIWDTQKVFFSTDKVKVGDKVKISFDMYYMSNCLKEMCTVVFFTSSTCTECISTGKYDPLVSPNVITVSVYVTRGSDIWLQKIGINMIYGNIVLLTELITCGTVCQIVLSLLILRTRLKIDWITSGIAKILCMILKHKFAELQVTVCCN